MKIANVSTNVLVQRLKYLLANLYVKIEKFFESVIFQIACLEIDRLTDLNKLLEIYVNENSQNTNIYDYIEMISRESDVLKKLELELKVCQYFVNFVYCKRFFIYKPSVYDISEIYKKKN